MCKSRFIALWECTHEFSWKGVWYVLEPQQLSHACFYKWWPLMRWYHWLTKGRHWSFLMAFEEVFFFFFFTYSPYWDTVDVISSTCAFYYLDKSNVCCCLTESQWIFHVSQTGISGEYSSCVTAFHHLFALLFLQYSAAFVWDKDLHSRSRHLRSTMSIPL